jgi:hypothetical protein
MPSTSLANLPLGIVYLSPDQLKLDSRNPRVHGQRHLKQLAKSIEAFGFNAPVLIDDDDIVIAGHGRVTAARQMKLLSVPAVRLSHLNEHQRRAYLVADNRLSELSSWNEQGLAEIMLELAEADLDFDIGAVGFSVAEIDLMVDGMGDERPDTADLLPDPGPTVCCLGDRWQLGAHVVVCASALDPASYPPLMDDEKADLVAGDPPFNVPILGHVSGLGKVKHREFAQAVGELSESEFIAFLEHSFRNAADWSRDGSLHYWAMDWRHLHELITAARAVYDEQVNLCVWAKSNAGMGSFYRSQHELFGVWRKGKTRHTNNVELGRFGRSRSNVWQYPGANSFGRASDEGNLLSLHPTVKPVALMADLILDSTQRGGLVLDPFLGSGSTLIAADKVGRRCRGIELDPAYVDTLIRRWQRWSGEQARRGDGAMFDDLDAAREDAVV